MIRGKVKLDTSGFDALALTMLQAVTLAGAKAGGKIVQKAMKAGAPRASRALSQSIGTKAEKVKGKPISFVVVGARKKFEKQVRRKGRKKPQRAVPAFYAHLVEKGTKPHSVKKGQSLGRSQRLSKRGKLFGKIVAQTDQTGRQHPGTRARPFAAQAWSATKDQAAAATLQAVGEATQKEIAKASAKVLAQLSGAKR